MCQYFSCIITKDFKVHWSKRTINHEDLLNELRIEDTTLAEREFVRIEIVPKNMNKITRDEMDWALKVDEQKTLPDWYEKHVVKCQKLIWEAWKESVKIQVGLGNEEHVISDQWFLAGDSSHVVAGDSSHVEARGSSYVVAGDSSYVVARDSSYVVACGSSHVVAGDSSHVEIKSDFVMVVDSQGVIHVSKKAKVVRKDV